MSVHPPVTTAHRPDRQRVEATTADGTVAGFAQYVVRDGDYVFFHTEIDATYEGHGLGSLVAAGALDFVRANGLRVVPRCPFLRSYMRRHPETHDLLAGGATLDADSEDSLHATDA